VQCYILIPVYVVCNDIADFRQTLEQYNCGAYCYNVIHNMLSTKLTKSFEESTHFPLIYYFMY